MNPGRARSTDARTLKRRRFPVRNFLLFVLYRIFVHIMRQLFLFIIICIWTATGLSAQNMTNQYGQYGTSSTGSDATRYDRNGNPIDTTAVVDANTVPIGLSSWKVDQRFGDRIEMPVDTLQEGFQNSNDTGGRTGHYTFLGNLGAPRLSQVFFERAEGSQYFFLDPYDFTVKQPRDIVYTNTKSPFTNLTYYKHGGGRNGEERFKSYFAVNAGRRLGFGFDIDYTYGRGKYQNQSTALFNGDVFAYYHGDKYEMHFDFVNENLKMAENGGITDDRYITSPLEMQEGQRAYGTADIPVRFANIWNHNRGYHAFLTHRYNVGFYREVKQEKDTVAREVFVPVTSFIHTVQADINKREYRSYDNEQNLKYFEHNYLGSDSLDVTKHFSVKNTVGIALREGFNKWAQAGLTAFASYEHRKFTLTDTLSGGGRRAVDYAENVLSVGGRLIKEQGKTLHYDVTGEFVVMGEDIGQFSVEGRGDLNFRLWQDTVRFQAHAYVKNLNPTFYYRHFHSKHYWWDNDLSKSMRTRMEGTLAIDRWRTRLTAGVENVTNYTYIDNASVKYTTEATESSAASTSYKDDAVVRQQSGSIQILSASLRQDFKLGALHLDNEITYQKSSNSQVLPLPEWLLYHNLYLRFGLAKKVLSIEMGADMRYFTKYYAPDYSPVIGQFYLQNADNRIKLGGYPLVNGYVNLHLKRTRFFIQMYNLLQGTQGGSYFLVPHYPLNPRILKIGISWNFFD